MVLVDSSVWIEALRREGDVQIKLGLESLLEADEALWCGPVKLEVLGGAPKAQRKKLAFFFQAVPYRNMDSEAWSRAVRLSWSLRDEGITVPWNDVLIASLALNWNCRIYAKDRHFDLVSDVAGLSLYQPGYGGRFDPE